MSKIKPQVGDVVEIPLSSGGVAYGRVLKDAGIAIYKETAKSKPPIGSRDYQFVVGVYNDELKKLSIVDHDPSNSPNEDWPPPRYITDVINGSKRIYYQGK